MWADLPLVAVLVAGGLPLVADLAMKLVTGRFGSDLLAGLSIVTSVILGEYLAGALVVLMLSGGAALEARAVSRAGDVLRALARRMPTLAHRKTPASATCGSSRSRSATRSSSCRTRSARWTAR
jgi:cation transport ATPase